MKTYEVTRSMSGEIGVLVKTDNGRNATILPHCVLHSPTGFETGYGGSGPADLALSILADFLGVAPERMAAALKNTFLFDLSTPSHKAFRYHQDFKWQFISGRNLAPGKSYEILGAEIASWIGDRDRSLSEK
jgi:hypothetical protein